MSELKVYVHPLKTNIISQTIVGQSYYLKSEADRYIEELKEQIEAANTQIENTINNASRIMLMQDKVNDNKCNELRHQKRKRCLAMARCCNRMFSSTFGKERYWQKWNRRWLELAEKFKEVK